MNIRVFAVSALLMTAMPLAHAATPPAQPRPVLAGVADSSSVIVKIGQASLEEYVGGNPANRIQLLRGAQEAQKAAVPSPGKCRS